MKAGLAAALLACREAARLGLAGDVIVAAVADEEHASLGVQEALDACAPTPPSSPSRPSSRSSSPTRASCGWRSRSPAAPRTARGPHLGVDAIVNAGPLLTALGALDDALAERDASAARARLGARVPDRRRQRAVDLPGPLRDRPRAPHAARRDAPATSRPRSTRCSPLPGGRPRAARHAPHAARARAVRGRPGAGRRRSCEAAAEVLGAPPRDRRPATGPTRRSSPPPASRRWSSAPAAPAPTPPRSG